MKNLLQLTGSLCFTIALVYGYFAMQGRSVERLPSDREIVAAPFAPDNNAERYRAMMEAFKLGYSVAQTRTECLVDHRDYHTDTLRFHFLITDN